MSPTDCCDETLVRLARRLNIARRFGSAMISNTDSTLLVYSTEHIRVKVYIGKGAQATVSVGVRDAPSDAFLAGAIQSAARSGRFSIEAGTRAAAPFPAPLSPLAASFLRCAPDRFLLTKPNTSCTIELPASLRSDGVRVPEQCSDSLRNMRSASPESSYIHQIFRNLESGAGKGFFELYEIKV